jgi:replicative DNA helicase
MSTLKKAPEPNVDPLLNKSLPSNLDAERMILGCILLSPECWEQAEAMSADAFFLPSNQKIFAAMRRIAPKIGPLELQEELARVGELDQVGGPAYIASLFDGCPRFSNIESYIAIVQQKYRLRRLATLANTALYRAFDAEDSPEEQIAEIERQLVGIGETGSQSCWRSGAQVSTSYLAEVQERAGSDRHVVGFSTGFYHLDNVTLGFERKQHIVIGARPGVGKTALGLSLTLYLAMSQWNQVDSKPPVIAWFSMEMSAEQLMRRLLATLAGVDSRALHMGRLSPAEWHRVSDADAIISNLRIHFDDRCGLSIPKIRQAVRKLRQQESAVDIVITDYLQLGDGERQKGQTRAEEVSAFCGGMTQMFKEQNICGISMAQLNRDAHGNRPELRDFKESGRIEQDASIVIGLHRPAGTDVGELSTAELVLLKQRNGPLCTVRVGFDSAKTWFYEPERSAEKWQQVLNRFR